MNYTLQAKRTIDGYMQTITVNWDKANVPQQSSPLAKLKDFMGYATAITQQSWVVTALNYLSMLSVPVAGETNGATKLDAKISCKCKNGQDTTLPTTFTIDINNISPSTLSTTYTSELTSKLGSGTYASYYYPVSIILNMHD